MSSNNFYALRLFAAAAVLFGHGFAVAGESCEPLIECYLGYTNISRLAVDTFFVLSGYLITKSWTDDPHVLRFLTRRILRIMPALIVTVFVSAFVIGPIVTHFSISEYISSPQTWNYLWWCLLRPTSFELPGVFIRSPLPLMNASLWTLPIEASFYLSVAAIGRFGGVNKIGVLFTFFIMIAANFILGSRYEESAIYFAAGSLAWVFRDRLAFSPVAALGLCLLAIVSGGSVQRWLILICLPYITLAFALMKGGWLNRVSKWGDLSYGTYLWAFPVQQLVQLYLHPGPEWGIAISTAITLPIAFLSWRLVEAPMLRFKPQARHQ